MFHRYLVPDNRRFVPTTLFWIVLLGLGSFLLLNRTQVFSTVPVANWAVMTVSILFSLALSIYFLVSLVLYLKDNNISKPVMAIILVVILLFLGLTLFRISQNLKAAEWKMEPWGDVFLRYTHPGREQSLSDLKGTKQQIIRYRGKAQEAPPKDTKSLWYALGFAVLCLVCNLIYRPYRLKMAKERGYNTESALNLLTGVIMLLLLVAGIAKPVCLLWLGGLALALFLLRLPRLGLLHALLFTLFQPLALADMGFSRMKYNSMIASTPRTGAGIFYNNATFVGLNMARKEEVGKEAEEDKQIKEALNKKK